MTDDDTTDDDEQRAPPATASAGPAPPAPARPSAADPDFAALLEDIVAVSRAHLVRLRPGTGDDAPAPEAVLAACGTDLRVLGRTLTDVAGVDGVLVEADHDPAPLAEALALGTPGVGVAVTDVTAEVRAVLDRQAPEASHEAFRELRAVVDRAPYVEVVEALAEVSLPGEPDPGDQVESTDPFAALAEELAGDSYEDVVDELELVTFPDDGDEDEPDDPSEPDVEFDGEISDAAHGFSEAGEDTGSDDVDDDGDETQWLFGDEAEDDRGDDETDGDEESRGDRGDERDR